MMYNIGCIQLLHGVMMYTVSVLKMGTVQRWVMMGTLCSQQNKQQQSKQHGKATHYTRRHTSTNESSMFTVNNTAATVLIAIGSNAPSSELGQGTALAVAM